MQERQRRMCGGLFAGLVTAAICVGQSGCVERAGEPTGTPHPSPTVAVAASSTPYPTVAAGGAATGAGAGGSNLASTRPGYAQQGSPAQPVSGAQPLSATRTQSPAPAFAPPRALPPPPPTPTPRVFTLPAGRTLSVYTQSTLSTKSNRVGETFVASLANPIVDGDWVIAKKGALVEGVVVKADPGGRIEGVASMSVALKTVQLADGRTVAISTSSYAKEARTTKTKDAVKIGIGAGIGAAIGAIAGGGKGAAIGAGVGGGAGTATVLATRGDPAVISSESLLSFRLSRPITVTKRQ